MTNRITTLFDINFPIVQAGILAAMALGADGVRIGSRFATSEESSARSSSRSSTRFNS